MKTHALRVLGLVAVAGLFASTASHANAPPGRYTIPTTGVVYDTKTKLKWQAGFATNVPWGTAAGQTEAICKALTLDGGGWRLPTLKELQSLVDYTVPQSAGSSSPGMIDSKFFPGTPGFEFWSSTLVAGNSANGWYVEFADGSTGSNGTDGNTWDLRCVK
jgi:hypothetical protein